MQNLADDRANRWWQFFLGLLESRFPLSDDSLTAWRERIFFAILLCSLAVGLVPLFSSIKISIEMRLWWNLVLYVLFYVWSGCILLVRRFSFAFRAWNGVIIYFGLGVTALLTLGPAGSGRAWFFGSAVLASLLLGLRAGLLVLGGTATALFTVGRFLASGHINWPLLSFYSVETWFSTSTTLLFLCAMVTASLAVLVAGLERSLKQQKAAAASLTDTKTRLEAEVEHRKKAQEELARYHATLEEQVASRTAELAQSNRTLTAEIASRKRMEAALSDSEGRYRQLVQHAPAGIFEIDLAADRFLHVNDLMCRLMGLQRDLFLRTPPLGMIAPGSRAAYRLLRASMLAGDEMAETQELQFLAGDGREPWLLLNTNIARERGRATRARVVAHDITERRKAEEALLHLASGVSHNFNNSLMAIMTNSQGAQSLLERETPDIKAASQLIANVLRAARSGQDVVRRLSRYVSGQGKPGREAVVVDLKEVVDEVCQLAKGAWSQVEEGRIALEVSLEPGLFVRGGRGELVEVVLNLVKNAIEAMPEGGLIRMTGSRFDGKAVLEVTDSGPGLPEDIMANLFQPFLTSKVETGMGLGLAISQGIVRANGGNISGANRAEGGARFTVQLPMASQGPVLPAAEPAPRKKFSPKRILLVEDEGLVAMGIEFILKEAGHQVRVARDKRQAMAALPDYRPEAVLCDLGLPDGSGWDVLAAVNEWATAECLPKIPVMVLTGWATGRQLEQPDGVPAPFAVMTKPLDRERLLKALAEALKS